MENRLQKTVKQYVSAMNNHESGQLYDLVVMGVEKSLLEMVSTETGRNQTQAAKILKMSFLMPILAISGPKQLKCLK